MDTNSTMAAQFQSTLPAWGETLQSARRLLHYLFQSTLPAWGETGPAPADDRGADISIHSPRMGRDNITDYVGGWRKYFNPLSPHGERRERTKAVVQELRFQSTLPAWGETAG